MTTTPHVSTSRLLASPMSEQRDAWTIEPLPVDRARQATMEAIKACVDRVDGLTELDWTRSTKLAGWTVIDLIWHIARAAARNAELLRHAMEHLGPLPEVSDWGLAHPNDPEPPPATSALVAHLREGHDLLAGRLGEIDESLEDLAVPTTPSGGTSLRHWLSSYVMEFGVHYDDLERALGDVGPLRDDVLTAIFASAPSMILEHARNDGLQPVAPRGYLLTAHSCHIAFHWNEAWSPGPDPSIPTATITADDTSIARLLVGRASVGEPPQQIGGTWHLALDLPRWCGVW